MNYVCMIGNLAADPEMRKTASGTDVCTFRIAVQRRFAGQDGKKIADFFNVVAWRQLGELCGKYLAKGRKCCVSGTLQTRSYDADGGKRYVTEIIAEQVEFLNNAGSERAPLPEEPPERSTGYTEVDDDELPF